AYPYGVAISADGSSLWFTESWEHRISRLPLDRLGGSPEAVVANLPGYPARLHRDGNGGFLLALFARRTHLIEFVLKEDD
ncbi:UNVERIFIED_CONTAM: SMP-30/gluconolactonase/LRE family protein, partial [Bacteroidetes bacterium 56_B9]